MGPIQLALGVIANDLLVGDNARISFRLEPPLLRWLGFPACVYGEANGGYKRPAPRQMTSPRSTLKTQTHIEMFRLG